MKTIIIPKTKEQEWIVSCIHRGQTLTAPGLDGQMISGIVTQILLFQNVQYVVLKTFEGNYRTVRM